MKASTLPVLTWANSATCSKCPEWLTRISQQGPRRRDEARKSLGHNPPPPQWPVHRHFELAPELLGKATRSECGVIYLHLPTNFGPLFCCYGPPQKNKRQFMYTKFGRGWPKSGGTSRSVIEMASSSSFLNDWAYVLGAMQVLHPDKHVGVIVLEAGPPCRSHAISSRPDCLLRSLGDWALGEENTHSGAMVLCVSGLSFRT